LLCHLFFFCIILVSCLLLLVSLNCSVLQPRLWRRLCIAGKSFIFSCLLFSRF
ncbi:unnamed protein product, partial [Sphagnum balticum]